MYKLLSIPIGFIGLYYLGYYSNKIKYIKYNINGSNQRTEGKKGY